MTLLNKVRAAVAGAVLGASMSLGWGGPYSEATNPSPDRSNIMYMAPADSRQALPRWTRRQINAKVEWLWQSFGVVKEGVLGITRHTVGRGRSLQINSDDAEFNELAELDWETYALSKDRCDLAGLRNFYDFQNFACEQRLKKGEFLGAHVQNPRWPATYKDGSPMLGGDGDPVGDPCMMCFDADEIQTPPGKGVEDRIFDGVQLDENNAATFYYALVAGCKWQAMPASEVVHWFKPNEAHQRRGVSEMAQSVARLVDIHDLIKVTTKSGKTHGAMALLVKKAAKVGGAGSFSTIRQGGNRTPTPAPPPSDGQQPPGGATQGGGQPLEQVFGGGAIMYVTEDGDVKLVNSTQPSPLVEPFITDLLMRDVCAGWGVPAEFFWCIAKLSGANTRAVLMKADLLFVVLGDGLDTEVNTPWATRYLLHRIACGKLRPCKDPNWLSKMSWQGPPRLTVDEGRTGMLELAQLSNGATTLQIMNESRGRGWRPTVKQWFREFNYAYRCAVEEKVPWAMRFWRAAQPGAVGGSPDTPPVPGSDKPEPGGNDTGKKEEKPSK